MFGSPRATAAIALGCTLATAALVGCEESSSADPDVSAALVT
ncbi:hypothetical protein ACIQAC_36620 [Streptomyces sp. NPDC088387]